MATILKTVFQFRRAMASEWEANKTVIPAAGEPCFVIDKGILKIGDGTTTFENLEPINGAKVEVAADGKSIVMSDGTFQLMGFDAAEAGAQPRKAADGTIEWIVPSTETVEGLQSTVSGLQSDVTALQKIVGTAEEGVDPLAVRVKTVEDAISTLNGDATVEGSVKKVVADEINAFATKINDDEVINTYKELIDYAAEHKGEATAMAGDITTLKGLVGTTSVEDQIAAAVADKVTAEEGKSLVDDTLIAKLESLAEDAQANTIEVIKVGDTVLDIANKQVVIPVGAGLKGSDEVEIAEDGTIRIKALSFDKLIAGEESIVMDGGSAV